MPDSTTAMPSAPAIDARRRPCSKAVVAGRSVPREEVARIQGIYGTVELSDAAAIQAIHGIGMVRQNARQLQQALLNIETDTLTNRDDMNTMVGLLNKLGAVQVLAARGDQVTNQLLVSLLEERLVAGKRQRDIEAQTLNSYVIFEREARDTLSQHEPRHGAGDRIVPLAVTRRAADG